MPIDPPVCDYQNYDGVKYEDDKAAFRKLTGPKSRLGFPPNHCLKFDCAARDKKCDDCFRFSEYIETESK